MFPGSYFWRNFLLRIKTNSDKKFTLFLTHSLTWYAWHNYAERSINFSDHVLISECLWLFIMKSSIFEISFLNVPELWHASLQYSLILWFSENFRRRRFDGLDILEVDQSFFGQPRRTSCACLKKKLNGVLWLSGVTRTARFSYIFEWVVK